MENSAALTRASFNTSYTAIDYKTESSKNITLFLNNFPQFNYTINFTISRSGVLAPLKSIHLQEGQDQFHIPIELVPVGEGSTVIIAKPQVQNDSFLSHLDFSFAQMRVTVDTNPYTEKDLENLDFVQMVFFAVAYFTLLMNTITEKSTLGVSPSFICLSGFVEITTMLLYVTLKIPVMAKAYIDYFQQPVFVQDKHFLNAFLLLFFVLLQVKMIEHLQVKLKEKTLKIGFRFIWQSYSMQLRQ